MICKENSLKLLTALLLVVPYLITLLFFTNAKLVESMGFLIGYLVAAHWIYAVIFNTDMAFSFGAVKPEQENLRVMGLLIGLMVVIALWGLALSN